MNKSAMSKPDSLSSGSYNTDSKMGTVIEVAGVYMLVLAALWATEYIPGFETWQRQFFTHPILSTFLSIVLIPVLALLLQSKSDKNTTIMGIVNVKKALQIGSKSFWVMMPATFFSFPVVGALGYSFYGWTGGLILAGVHLLAIPCLLFLFKKEHTLRESGFSTTDLMRILAIFIIAAGLIYGLQFVQEKISRIIVMLVFVGFAEEFMFRGYIQGRLNQAFVKPFEILSFSFGWGFICASLLFGLMHVLSPGNPLHLAWGVWTFTAGLCFGIIREKGGGFLAPALVHGIIMVFPVFFG